MARRKRPLLDFVMNTIQQTQANNRDNPNQETAAPMVFDLIKGQIGKIRENRQKGGTPILDLIKAGVEKARTQNINDPGQKNAPGAIFDAIKDKMSNFEAESAQDDFDLLLDEYNIDDEAMDQGVLTQIEQAFNNDRKRLREAYGQKLKEFQG